MKSKPVKEHSLQSYHLCEVQTLERQASIPAKYHCNSYSLFFLLSVLATVRGRKIVQINLPPNPAGFYVLSLFYGRFLCVQALAFLGGRNRNSVYSKPLNLHIPQGKKVFFSLSSIGEISCVRYYVKFLAFFLSFLHISMGFHP